MRILGGTFLVIGFISLFLAALTGTIIAGVGPGSMERAVGALASAVAGSGTVLAAATLIRPS